MESMMSYSRQCENVTLILIWWVVFRVVTGTLIYDWALCAHCAETPPFILGLKRSSVVIGGKMMAGLLSHTSAFVIRLLCSTMHVVWGPQPRPCAPAFQ